MAAILSLCQITTVCLNGNITSDIDLHMAVYDGVHHIRGLVQDCSSNIVTAVLHLAIDMILVLKSVIHMHKFQNMSHKTIFSA